MACHRNVCTAINGFCVLIWLSVYLSDYTSDLRFIVGVKSLPNLLFTLKMLMKNSPQICNRAIEFRKTLKVYYCVHRLFWNKPNPMARRIQPLSFILCVFSSVLQMWTQKFGHRPTDGVFEFKSKECLAQPQTAQNHCSCKASCITKA